MTKRVYVWTHNWLSPIQKGIQGAHAVVELSSFCCSKAMSKSYLAYETWALHQKTLVFLSGGSSETLRELKDVLVGSLEGENETYWAEFREDQESMEGMLTAIAVLPTSNVCDAIDYCREHGYKDCRSAGRFIFKSVEATGVNFNLTGWEANLVNVILSARLAS